MRENQKPCEFCGKPAKFLVGMFSPNNSNTNRLFCQSCAQEFECIHFGGNDMTVTKLFNTLILENLNSQNKDQQAEVCPKCANTVQNVREAGLAGCSLCYMVFKEEIENVIRELHGTKFGNRNLENAK